MIIGNVIPDLASTFVGVIGRGGFRGVMGAVALPPSLY